MGADDRKYMGQNEGHLGSRGCWGNWSRPHLHALLRNDLSQRPPPTGGPSSCRPLSGVLRFRFQIQPPLCLSLQCQSPGATSSRGSERLGQFQFWVLLHFTSCFWLLPLGLGEGQRERGTQAGPCAHLLGERN